MTCPRDGSEIPERSQPAPVFVPPDVPGYRIEGLLGLGGFSRVWDARHEIDEEPVALKVGHASTELARSRFVREADALSVIGAPYVPALYDRGVLKDGRPYLVMERLDIPILADVLAQRLEPPAVAWIRDIGDTILRSLQAVHDNNLIHSDLKPENIFLSENPPIQARLTDFGIVRLDTYKLAAETTSEHTVIGTAEYMAPEQLAGANDVDIRVDIYAFGVLLYELLTLRVPFSGDLASIEKGHRALRPPRPSDFAAVPAALEELCLACLTKDASRRPKDVPTLRSRLAEACHDAGDTTILSHESSGPVPLLQVTRQPVVLVAVELESLDHEVSKLVTRRKGFVARQQGLSMLCGFSGLLDEKPEQAALAMARELIEKHDARAVLHFDELTMRPGSGRRAPKLYGPSVHQPKAWLPPREWSGLLLTRAMAEVLPEEHTQPAPGLEGFFLPVAGLIERTESRLFGRDDVQERASEALRQCLDDTSPGLMTVIGEHGLGKSRLARAIHELANTHESASRVHLLQATRRSVGHASETYRRLRQLISSNDATSGAGIRAHTGDHSAVIGLGDDLRQVAGERPLVVIIDDAHYADDKTLDVIEYATLNGPGLALWIVVCAHPRLLRRRPRWGERANRHHTITLQPLAESATIDMAADLLRPAEFPPKAILRKLAQWTGGNPQSLEQLVRTLKRRGVVRRRSNNESWYVATAELEQLPASPVGQWLAARQLDSMPLEQAACVRVCAVLGQEFSRDELSWVQSAAERDRIATTTIDTDIGLEFLAGQGIITPVSSDLWAFAQASFQDAIYKLVSQRDRENIHRYALAFWQSRASEDDSDRVWASLARHAGFCGDREIAADANLKLGDRALHAHRHVEADLYYTGALGFIDDGDALRNAHALGRRGSSRYRMQRIQESLQDLLQAQKYARILGDEELFLGMVLEEATALDWASQYEESALRVADVASEISADCSPWLRARFLMAEGRSFYRIAHAEEAIERLEEAVLLGGTVNDEETCAIALLLLATLLAFAGKFEASERRFGEVIDLCTKTGDRFHLCVAYNNRYALWMESKSFSRVRADLRRTIQLAREVGQPILERSGTHNLAEYLYRSGQFSDALELANRAYDLRRFTAEQVAADPLLLARVLTACGKNGPARTMVDEARVLAHSGEPSNIDDLLIHALDLALRAEGAPEDWSMVVAQGRERLSVATYLEVVYYWATSAARTRQWAAFDEAIREAHELLSDCPIWEKPFADLLALAAT